MKKENPYTTAYFLAYDAYQYGTMEMLNVLTDCMIVRMISEREAEMIAEDVICEYNTK